MVFHIKYCFDGKLFNLKSLQAQTKVQKEMPRSQNTANPRHQKKELYEINNDKTNVTYETTNAWTMKTFNREASLVLPVEKTTEGLKSVSLMCRLT